MPEQARLRVYGEGDVEVELVAAYLSDLKHVRFRLTVRDDIEWCTASSSEFPFPRYPIALDFDFGWPTPRRGMRRTRVWPPTAEEVASYTPHAEQLILSAVSLASPGF